MACRSKVDKRKSSSRCLFRFDVVEMVLKCGLFVCDTKFVRRNRITKKIKVTRDQVQSGGGGVMIASYGFMLNYIHRLTSALSG